MPIFPTVLASILYIGRPSSANLAYLSSLLLPSCLLSWATHRVISRFPSRVVFLVPGTFSSMIPAQVSIHIIPTGLSVPPLHVEGTSFTICAVILFFFRVSTHLSISFSIAESMHSPQSSSFSILILFTKLFSCFLCVSVISLLGRG
jgi:hypothetical protein